MRRSIVLGIIAIATALLGGARPATRGSGALNARSWCAPDTGFAAHLMSQFRYIPRPGGRLAARPERAACERDHGEPGEASDQ